jgi:serine/threonine protein phosphatase PrpC
MKKDATGLHWSSASRTDVGKVRKLNEDSLLDLPELGLWMVADGMGGHAAGDFASGAIVSALASIPPPVSLGALLGEVRVRLQTVNRELHEEARTRRERVIGSTVVVLLVYGGHGVVVWAGDSRAYLYRRGELIRLTRDHSQVEELVRRGLITPDQVEGHPAANVITRAIGVADFLELDSEMFTLAEDDIFLLCSDGLYRELDDKAIKACLALGTCQQSCDALIDGALAQRARDNVSVIVVRMTDEAQATRTQYNPSVGTAGRPDQDQDDPTELG